MNQLTEKSISCPYCGESIEVLLDAADIDEQYILGSVDLSRLNLQQSVWYLGKAEPIQCGYSP